MGVYSDYQEQYDNITKFVHGIAHVLSLLYELWRWYMLVVVKVNRLALLGFHMTLRSERSKMS